MINCCHSLSLAVTRYHSLSLDVIRCHSLPFVVICCLSLSFVITYFSCTTRCHSLSLVPPLVSLAVTRCHWMYKRSFKRGYSNWLVACVSSCRGLDIKIWLRYHLCCHSTTNVCMLLGRSSVQDPVQNCISLEKLNTYNTGSQSIIQSINKFAAGRKILTNIIQISLPLHWYWDFATDQRTDQNGGPSDEVGKSTPLPFLSDKIKENKACNTCTNQAWCNL